MKPGIVSSDDPSGLQTLLNFSKADQFNKWLHDAISPYYKKDVLEIGSGIGSISAFILHSGYKTVLSDLRTEYCQRLNERFKNHPNLTGIAQIDLSTANFEQTYAAWLGKFDAVIALNVIEHIKDDHLAIRNCYRLLKKEGKLIMLVPAFSWLFNSLDKELGHFRRYTKKTVATLLLKENFSIESNSYFNFAGMGGWWFAGNLLKKKLIPEKQLSLYNALVPAFRLLDKLILNSAGLSVVTVAAKKQE